MMILGICGGREVSRVPAAAFCGISRRSRSEPLEIPCSLGRLDASDCRACASCGGRLALSSALPLPHA